MKETNDLPPLNITCSRECAMYLGIVVIRKVLFILSAEFVYFHYNREIEVRYVYLKSFNAMFGNQNQS